MPWSDAPARVVGRQRWSECTIHINWRCKRPRSRTRSARAAAPRREPAPAGETRAACAAGCSRRPAPPTHLYRLTLTGGIRAVSWRTAFKATDQTAPVRRMTASCEVDGNKLVSLNGLHLAGCDGTRAVDPSTGRGGIPRACGLVGSTGPAAPRRRCPAPLTSPLPAAPAALLGPRAPPGAGRLGWGRRGGGGGGCAAAGSASWPERRPPRPSHAPTAPATASKPPAVQLSAAIPAAAIVRGRRLPTRLGRWRTSRWREPRRSREPGRRRPGARRAASLRLVGARCPGSRCRPQTDLDRLIAIKAWEFFATRRGRAGWAAGQRRQHADHRCRRSHSTRLPAPRRALALIYPIVCGGGVTVGGIAEGGGGWGHGAGGTSVVSGDAGHAGWPELVRDPSVKIMHNQRRPLPSSASAGHGRPARVRARAAVGWDSARPWRTTVDLPKAMRSTGRTCRRGRELQQVGYVRTSTSRWYVCLSDLLNGTRSQQQHPCERAGIRTSSTPGRRGVRAAGHDEFVLSRPVSAGRPPAHIEAASA